MKYKVITNICPNCSKHTLILIKGGEKCTDCGYIESW